MKISLNWIREFVSIPAKYSAKELAELLTVRTCEVEGFEDEAAKFYAMVVGKVVSMKAHPNADKLRLADTDIGGKVVQIVCGGQNLCEGMTVAVALPGAKVKWHGEGELIELKETKIRGEHSFGMICAGEEIGLPSSPEGGITDLGELFKKWGLPLAKPGTPLAAALGVDDTIFEVDNKSITHRPDLWGHYGMAREFAAMLDEKLKHFKDFKIPPVKIGKLIKVEITKPEIAARFLSVAFTNIRVEPSPAWLQKRLQAVGTRPVNNIVDITNHVMLELGQPLHAFDRKVVGEGGFVVRFAKDKEEIVTLDHKKRQLTKDDAVVTNGKEALAIAGVMGGLNSEIAPHTTDIVLEVATWNPIMVRKTAQRHALRTDSAARFEKSLDPENTGMAFARACELILQICRSAKIASPVTDIYPKKAKEPVILLNMETVKRKIGVEISEKEMIKHLNALEFGAKKKSKGVLQVTVPTHRATKDVSIEDDLVEEIARMHGYEKITPTLPLLPIKLPIENRERSLKHEARNISSLVLGFSEVNLYSFYGKSEIAKCLLPPAAHILIDNPLTEDQTHMRISLLPNLLKAATSTLNTRDEFKLYEIGRTYIKTENLQNKDVLLRQNDSCLASLRLGLEEKFICGIVVGEFDEGLGAAQSFLKLFRAKNTHTEIADKVPPYAHPSKCAKIGKDIAIVYEVHPQVLQNFGIKKSITAFEINFTKLVAGGRKEVEFTPLPRFPGIAIDVSVLVGARTPLREIMELIRRADNKLIANISLVDIFEDKSLGEGKKSFTVRILLQSPDRTLTDDEMKTVQERIFRNLHNCGFTIRGQ